MSSTNLNSSGDVLKRRLKGLVFIDVRFDAKTKKFEVRKCRLLEPVYILSMQIFKEKNEGFILKNQNNALIEDAGLPEFRKDFQAYLKQTTCESLEEFEDGLVSMRRDESMQKQRDQRQSENSLPNLPQRPQSMGQDQQLKYQNMKQIVAVLNDDRSLNEIHQDILETKNSHNIIELGYNMNFNVFHNFNEFFNRFSYVVNAITKDNEQNKHNHQSQHDNSNKSSQNFNSQASSQSTCYSSIEKEAFLDEVKLILKNRSKFLLFDSYSYQQSTLNNNNQPSQTMTYELESCAQHHDFYIVAASHFRQFYKLAEHLHYYHKSSPFIIYRNLQESLLRSAYKSLKDIIRITFWKKFQGDNPPDLYSMLNLLTSELNPKDVNNNNPTNVQNLQKNASDYSKTLIYKNICAQGILPVNLYLSTNVKSNCFRNFFLKLLNKCLTSPFNYNFHLSIQIMNKFYSFNDGSFYSCYDITDRERNINKQQQYTKIRIIDFFPLDTWITTLSDKLLQIINEIHQINQIYQINQKDCSFFDHLSSQRFIRKNEIENDSSFVRASLLGILKKGLWKEIKMISAEFLLEYFKELRFFQKWATIHAQSEQKYYRLSQNCFTGGSSFLSYFQQIFMHFSEPGEAILKDDLQEFQSQQTSFYQQQQLNNNNNNPNNNEGNLQQRVKDALLQRKVKIFNTFGNQNLNSQIQSKFIINPCNFQCLAPKLQFFCEETHFKYLNVVYNGEAQKTFQVLMETNQYSNIPILFRTIFKDLYINNNNLKDKQVNQIQSITSSSSISQSPNVILEISNLISIYDSFLFQRHKHSNYTNERFSFYQDRDILKELCYYYYNSVRLASDALLTKDASFSLVGHLIIKNPAKKPVIDFTAVSNNGRKDDRSQSDNMINYLSSQFN